MMTVDKEALISSQYRPYTSYNIFFQLEREFILQNTLGVTPSVSNVFDSAADDVIPMLPQRYQNIILTDDWYIPGKSSRKKRTHRKSHGKISFSDLSKRVSAAWQSCDDEVKLFCAEVSDLTMQKYYFKKFLQRQERDGTKTKKDDGYSSSKSNFTVSTRKNKSGVKKQQMKVALTKEVDIVSLLNEEENVEIEMIDLTHFSDSAVIRRVVSKDIESTNNFAPIPRRSKGHYQASLVDIDDEDIWKMWMSCDAKSK